MKTNSLGRCWVSFAAAAVLAAGPVQVAFAQEPPAPPPSQQPQTAPSAAESTSAGKLESARLHYERGVELFNEEAYEAALVEFQRAYSLTPSYKVLYNMGKLHKALKDFAAAQRDFTRYLEEGKSEIAASRRAEVQKEIAQLEVRVARLEVTSSVKGAEISVDDVLVGKTPISYAIVVNPGRRKVTASKEGYAPASKVVEVAGSDSVAVDLRPTDLSVSIADQKPPKPAGPRNRAIVSWAATAALAGGAGAFAYLTSKKSDDLDNLKNAKQPDPAALDSTYDDMRRNALIADIFAGAAVVGAGISIFFTVKAVQAYSEEEPAPAQPSVKVNAGLGSLRLTGTF
ncbi:PEGA domain-containing protein [Pendulispora albinea]|uniref:PEGA domain-containing protein n=1 Tax=Pendulispora albinea TaxID=2741071 RepID=A0ABZ2MAJ2_9BACT